MGKKGKAKEKGRAKRGTHAGSDQLARHEVRTEPHPDTEGFYNRRIQLEPPPVDTVFIEKRGSEVAVHTG
jgi:hypothetical protein